MTPVIFTNVARQVLAEFVRRGDVKKSSNEEMAALVEGYRDWIESYVAALVFEELGRLGRVSEFRILPDGDETMRAEFFRHVVPHYEEFLKRAVTLAAGALVGKPRAGSSQKRGAAA